jgi:hypothetical protein
MNTETHHDMHVETEFAEIIIGGTKLMAHIEGTIEFTFMREVEGGIGDRMEDATPGSQEVLLDTVDLDVYLSVLSPIDVFDEIHFKSTSLDFYEEHFGELELEDVIGYV